MAQESAGVSEPKDAGREAWETGADMNSGTRLVFVLVGGAGATVVLFQVVHMLGY